MKRGWFLLLALSLGLNAGLLYVELLGGQRDHAVSPLPPHHPGGGTPDGVRPARPDLGRPGPEHLIQDHLDLMTTSLALDDRQRAKISAVLNKFVPQILEQRERMHRLRQAVTAQYAAPEMDPEEFRTLVRRMNEAQAGLDSLTAEAMLGEADQLSTEQRLRYVREMPWGRPIPPHQGRSLGPPGRPPGEPSRRLQPGPLGNE